MTKARERLLFAAGGDIRSTLLSAADAYEQLAQAKARPRVLVADDDRDTTLTLMMLLRDEGYEVTAVHSGRSVLSAVIRDEPDAVILDINMPDMSGWQAAQTIRSRQMVGGPLLIGVSGVFTKGPDKILGHISGFDHYLVKPYALEDLLKLLEPLMNQRSNQ